jgi:hypothetical protein
MYLFHQGAIGDGIYEMKWETDPFRSDQDL